MKERRGIHITYYFLNVSKLQNWLSPFENYLVVTGNRQGREDTVIVTKGEDG